MDNRRTRRQKIRRRRRILFLCLLTVIIGLFSLIGYTIFSNLGGSGETSSKTASQGSNINSSKVEFKETTATVLSTGDIMVHSTQLDGALVKGTGEYDFSAFFKEVAPYFQKADLSVANLEVTFGGRESGAFSGYPAFNTPDSLADVIKSSGLNLLITANNHCYDTGLFGLKRTLQVLKQKSIEYTGTRETADEPTYITKKINNINIGIANYTYEVKPQNAMAGRKYINGNIISAEANPLINTFCYTEIEKFYEEARSIITEMKQKGAEYIVFYMHWGNEYQTTPNTHQKSIAQQLSNMGVDMIIGSHPHVVQPIEVIHSEDGQNTTVCLYSTGNAISNQRQELMDSCPTGHTEDGVLFGFTLRKTKDGVILDSLSLIPTWVNKYPGGSGYQYTIYPLEDPNDGTSKFGLNSTAAAKAAKSYERTKAIVFDGLKQCQQTIGCEVSFGNLKEALQ